MSTVPATADGPPTAAAEEALRRAQAPGARETVITLTADRARREARLGADRHRSGCPAGPVDGLTVVYKDNIDVAGTVTTAGSRTRADLPAAVRDAAVARRLSAAGTVTVAKVNLAEFALGGLGTNAHYGTPRNPRLPGAAPGGSSSGAAVAVAAGIAEIGVGTDTSGSVRVPAALCGLVGWRPSRGRYPRAGVLPLAPSLDTVGLITRTVPRLLAADAALRPDRARPAPVRPSEVTLVVPDDADVPEMPDPPVRARFELALTALEQAGVRIVRRAVGALTSVRLLQERYGPLVAHEAATTLPGQLTRGGEALLDPRVRERLEQSLAIADPAARRALLALRAPSQKRLDRDLEGALLAVPTTPCTAPALADVARAEAWHRFSARLLATTMLASFLDLPGVSLPMGPAGGPPTGLLLSGPPGADERVLAVAACLAPHLTPNRRPLVGTPPPEHRSGVRSSPESR
ncbi:MULTISPECIES: amidase family protein [unclassified Streptomyces]|uniref:amidase family protein n=1 Tax=unclassified Streptomyces TaxID=2593676 RepID=UPI000699E1E4|nr:amidase family protein [Streptomyces sp. CNQ-509]